MYNAQKILSLIKKKNRTIHKNITQHQNCTIVKQSKFYPRIHMSDDGII